MARFRTVIFDCDSTLTSLEGIDLLAGAIGPERRAEVEELTDAAMRGVVALEEVYAQRMALVRPSREDLDALGQRYIETLVDDARETVAALRAEGVDVRVVSGGMLPAILILTRHLGLPDEVVAAVDVYFDDDGEYADFDAGSPLAYAGGKRVAIERWLPELERPIAMVGDGMTDLEAQPVVDAFIAFAGVVERPTVVGAADIVVRAPSLAPILPLALDGEPPRDPTAQTVFEKGMRMAPQEQ
jgi:phosphoserine phosphatase